MSIIEVEDLVKTYKTIEKEDGLLGYFKNLVRPKYKEFTAVKSVNFNIEEGELVGYIGENGAGKSTTIKMLTGLLTPTSGKIVINGIIPNEKRIENNKNIGAINTIFSISSFWTYRSNEVIWSFYRMYTFTEYPITIYNKFIRILITLVLPFAFVSYYPTMAYLGLNTYMIYLSPIVAIILWIIAVKLWNLALNKYRSTGT